MSLPIHIFVEETDVGLYAEGFDNALLYADKGGTGLEELHEYIKVLKKIGAPQCAAIVQELLDWVCSDPERTPLQITNSDRVRTDALWRKYCAASHTESPAALAEKFDPPKKSKMPVTDRDYYEFFGAEDASKLCRHEGCSRGTVKFSTLCRTHHFEVTMKKPCPWTD